MNIQNWCSNSTIYNKCCLTCQSNFLTFSKKNILNILFDLIQIYLDYLSLNNCSDLAYTPDCVNALNNGLCNSNLSSSQNVRFYCQKTCGVCSSSTAALTCSNIVKTCNTGSCSAVSYFNQATIQCNCPSGLVGTYCQRRIWFSKFF